MLTVLLAIFIFHSLLFLSFFFFYFLASSSLLSYYFSRSLFHDLYFDIVASKMLFSHREFPPQH